MLNSKVLHFAGIFFANFSQKIFQNFSLRRGIISKKILGSDSMKKILLGDICKITSSKRIFEREYVNFGIPFIRGQEISDKSISSNKKLFECYISEKRYDELKKNYGVPQKNDILITAVGTIGNLYLVKNNQKFYFKDGNIIWIKDIEKNVFPKFLYYFMKSPYFNKQIQNSLIGAVQKALTIDMLSKIEIDLPPLEVQKQIGNFLYSLDQKISLNKKINATLEDMAKTIFLHKFFRKPTNGKISDILIENEKSAISVGEAKNSGGDFPFFTSGENILRWNEKLVDGRNIFLNDGGNVGIKFYVGAAAYSTHTYCITAKDNFADFLYLTLKIFESEIEKRFFTGTGLKNLRKDLLKDFAIYIPTQAELKNFNSAVQPCFDTISKNFRENNLLENLRDFLLPMLMNGQVTFAEED